MNILMASVTCVPMPYQQVKSSLKRKPWKQRLRRCYNINMARVKEESGRQLPMREIPGDYGVPFIGPIKDRLDYFYNQGRDNYFKSRQQNYNSTVFRANMPPGPFIASNPNVIVLLDAKSFPVLFDVSKVEKRDVFTGTYMPSTQLTGGYRVLSYLDPSEPKHEKLKRLLFFLLKSRSAHVIPEFHSALQLPLSRALYATNPSDTKLGTDGPGIIQAWLLFQIGPITSLGLPKFLEDPILHTFRFPSFLIKKDYQRLYDFFYVSGASVLDEAVRSGIPRAEACHNLLFATCFNSFGGIKIFFPTILKWVARAGAEVHARLAEEVRAAVKSSGGKVTMAAMEMMPLMKSVVYEAFRIEPPVPLQYGKAKRDLVIESHENSFLVKEGEMLFGYQPFATKDPKIFENPEEFVADRFVGEGEKLLKYVFWSNGPETEEPTLGNKQCAGKDFVVLFSRLLVVELFLRYDSFNVEVGTSALTFTSLKKASF
ncbi:hypothetical protein Fmac_000354 [Flemingia macrophylla]|uniref:Allene oxide synthase n=1 Tax=Flemingia macrophylla TaxID=520843 RepID=A0ABD1NE21_9FABA